MTELKDRIIQLYIPGKTSLRDVATQASTNHHTVKRVLQAANIPIVKAPRVFTEKHKANIRKAAAKRDPSTRGGYTQTKQTLYKNMAAHSRFDISWEWLSTFDDIDRLKILNKAITVKGNRYLVSTAWYVRYIEHFYLDPQLNLVYDRWVASDFDRYLKPSIDHKIPKSKGGSNELKNLQFVSWFENRAKYNMTLEQWEKVKSNLQDYLV